MFTKKSLALCLAVMMVLSLQVSALGEGEAAPQNQGGFFSNLWNSVSSFAQQASETISAAANDAGNWISQAYKDASQWTEQAVKDAGQWTEQAAKDVGQWTEQTYANVSGTVNQWISSMSGVKVSDAQAVWGWFTDQLDHWEALDQEMYQKIQEAVTQTGENAEQMVQSAIEELTEKAYEGKEAAQEILAAIQKYAETSGISALDLSKISLPFVFEKVELALQEGRTLVPGETARELTEFLEFMKNSADITELVNHLSAAMGTN